MKINESQQLKLFTSNTVDVYAEKFQPAYKLAFVGAVEGAEDLVLSLFPSGLNIFSLSKFNCSSKKESEKLKKSLFEQIKVQFVFCMV